MTDVTPSETIEQEQENPAPVDKVLLVPEAIDINEFLRKPLAELHQIAQKLELRVAGVRSKHHLVLEILRIYGNHGTEMIAEGVLDLVNDSSGFLRWPAFSFSSNCDDIFVNAGIIKTYSLRAGHKIRCKVGAPRDREKFLMAIEVLEIEGIPVSEWKTSPVFEDLRAMFPTERLILETPGSSLVSPRVMDIVAPLGKGQRGLIVAPPRGGKTILLKNIAVSIHKNNSEVDLIVLLLDERPEEVTDFRETVDTTVFSSTFDESSDRHIQVADMVLHRAKRLVEMGRDVVILLDSLTRLARAHNSARQSGSPSGASSKGRRKKGHSGGGDPIGSGGISPKALERSRRFFAAARNVDGGGSLTILATCLIETDSRMDDVIFEEFKGTGNMEVSLDREMAEARIFPAIHLQKSGTRKDDLLYHPDEFQRVTAIRKQLVHRPPAEAMLTLVKAIKMTRSNAELLLRGLQ